MLRLLILLVSMLTTRRPGGTAGTAGPARLPRGDHDQRDRDQRDRDWRDADWRDRDVRQRGVRERDVREREAWERDEWEDEDPWDGDTWYLPPDRPRYEPAPRRTAPRQTAPRQVIRGQLVRPGRRRRIPRTRELAWGGALLLVALIFRKVIAWAVLAVLSAALHLVGLNVRLPHVSFGWPWQSVTAGTTTDVSVGPWVLQKIEGISRPALGTENFNFTFTHKVSKNIGIWPCWYSSTFATTGHASATVDLNPGPGWWAPGTGHYQLQVLSRPATGVPGRVSVAIVLPPPQLPQSVHDVTVDNTMSHPVDVQHSWTYPGLGCGALIRPQFSVSVLYAQAQNLAFAQARNNPKITGPLIKAAEAQAAQIIRNNFVQPTVNA
ncbi:MAG TPA: hypothetical protein VFW50_02900, partial [Streptosporangiaceae bacterium]|nr:hypothetical protein [Streptosporangiaceae bacterium]